MSDSIWLWLFLNVISIVLLAYFSMLEMACVSFNKIRLQYYVGKGNKRAAQLSALLKNPSRLFGATLIGVNIALVFGSEFSRQLYASVGLSPDLAPLTQVIIVVIFGELAPMFAARRYSEHVAILGIPFLYAWSKIMTPLLWLIEKMTKVINVIIGDPERQEGNFYISKEELTGILSETEEERTSGTSQEFNILVSNIFLLRHKTAQKAMNALSTVTTIPSNYTVGEMRTLLSNSSYEYLPVYHRSPDNIIGVAFPRDFIRQPDKQKVKENVRQPWFITIRSPILQVLKQFRRNNQTVAVVLGDKGHAVGVLSLEDIVDEIFGSTTLGIESTSALRRENLLLIERSFPGEMKIEDFNKMYHVHLDSQGVETFAELLVKVLGHHPEEGESIFLPPFEIIVKEATLLDIKTVTVKTRPT